MVKQPKLQQSSEIDRITQKLISQVGEQITNPSDNPGQGHREKLDKMTKKLSTFFGAGLACWLAEGREVQGQEKNLPAGWIPGGGGCGLSGDFPISTRTGKGSNPSKVIWFFFDISVSEVRIIPANMDPLLEEKKGKKQSSRKRGASPSENTSVPLRQLGMAVVIERKMPGGGQPCIFKSRWDKSKITKNSKQTKSPKGGREHRKLKPESNLRGAKSHAPGRGAKNLEIKYTDQTQHTPISHIFGF